MAADEDWLDAPSLAEARMRLTAANAPWFGALGLVLHVLYALEVWPDVLTLIFAADLVTIGVFAALLLAWRQDPSKARRLRQVSVAAIGLSVLTFGIYNLTRPETVFGPSYVVAFAGIGFLVTSWRDFTALTAFTFAVSTTAAAYLGADLVIGVLTVLLPGILLGLLVHAFRIRTFSRLYLTHVESLAQQERLRRQERLSSLGKLVAGVAHEINNPLTYTMGNVELAKGDLEELRETGRAPDAAQLAEMIHRHEQSLAGLEQIRRIVQGLRLLARENAKAPRRAMPLGPLVEQVLAVISSHVPPAIKVSVDVPEECAAEVNEGEVSQILLNLMLNAAQALSGRAEGNLRVTGRVEDAFVRLDVHDDGPGIPPKVQPDLFRPFVTGKADGTGLGLSISLGIAQSYGGDISVVSEPGSTTFSLWLPRAGRAPVAARARSSA